MGVALGGYFWTACLCSIDEEYPSPKSVFSHSSDEDESMRRIGGIVGLEDVGMRRTGSCVTVCVEDAWDTSAVSPVMTMVSGDARGEERRLYRQKQNMMTARPRTRTAARMPMRMARDRVWGGVEFGGVDMSRE